MNQKGAGLIGLLLVVLIIGLLFYGGSFFLKKNNTKNDINKGVIDQQINSEADKLKALNQSKQQIQTINNQTQKMNEQIKKMNEDINATTTN